MALDPSNVLSRLAGPANVASGTSTVFTGTTLHIYTIKNIRIVNPTAGSITIALGIGGVANANLILPSTPIGAGETAEFDGLIVLSGAETLQASTTGSGLTITVSGLDQS